MSTLVAELIQWSAKLGADRHLTQGAGGNTSVKDGPLLWVKASGTWLQNAETADIFVPANRQDILDALATGEDRKAEWTSPRGTRLRSSIETSLHAVLPDRWVFHLHTVSSMLWSSLVDGRAQVAPKLEGLRWVWVRYERPGLPLTLAIQEVLADAPQILLLANHGLVISASTCGEVIRLLEDVETRLALPGRDCPAPVLTELEAVVPAGFRPARYADSHACALDPIAFAAATGGLPAPDFAVFLGAELITLDQRDRYRQTYAMEPLVLLVPSLGVLVSDSVSENGHLMLEALGRMLLRLPAGQNLTYLAQLEVRALLEWDAELYRKSLIPS